MCLSNIQRIDANTCGELLEFAKIISSIIFNSIMINQTSFSESRIAAAGRIYFWTRRSKCHLVFVWQICTDHNHVFSSFSPFLSVSVLMIKLTGVALRISTVRFECIILILESLKYVLSQV